MGDLLRNWVESSIKDKLNEGLNWLHRKAVSPSINDSSLFEDDGSNLRIKVTELGVVQIVKYTAFEESEPIQAEISDSFTRVKVTFAASAVEKFHSEEQKWITRDTLGSLIQIFDFEIVATHIGPRTSRLTILIKDFKIIGSEGSGTFDFPRPIENVEGILELLDKLKTFREKGSIVHREQTNGDVPKDSSPAESLDEDPLSKSGNVELDQQEFLTQIPPSRRTRSALVKAHKPDITSQRELGGLPIGGFSLKANKEVPKQSTSGSLKANPEILTNPKSGGLLRSPKRAQAKRSPKTTMKAKNIKAQELLSLLPGNQSSKSLTVSARPEEVKSTANQVSTEIGTTAEARDRSQADTAKAEAPVNEMPRSSQAHKMLVSNICEPSNTSRPATDKVASSGSIFPTGRIKEREVKIPRDQKALLERSECWMPAELGQREPVGNIPIQNLQAMSDRVEAFQRQFSKPNSLLEKNQDKAEPHASRPTTEPDTDSNEDSEPAVPIPSEEWPPSSPPQAIQEQLPPDSSAAVPAYTDNFQGDSANEEAPKVKRRKLSGTSAVSYSAASSLKGSLEESDISKASAPSSPVFEPDSSEKPLKSLNFSDSGHEQKHSKPLDLEYHVKHNHQATNLNGDASDSSDPEASMLTRNNCPQCHSHFDLPEDLIWHKKDTGCTAYSSQVIQSINESSPSLVHTNANQVLQKHKGNNQNLPDNDSIVRSAYNEPDVRMSSIPLDSSGAQPGSSSQTSCLLHKNLLRQNLLGEYSASTNSNGSERENGLGQISIISDSVITDAPTETQNPSTNSASIQIFHSSASQQEEPSLQVQRTPYANEPADVAVSINTVFQSSPSKENHTFAKKKLNGSVAYRSSSLDEIINKPCDEALSAKENKDPSSKENSDTNLGSPRSMDLDLIDQQVQDVIDAQPRSIFTNSLDLEMQDATGTRPVRSQLKSLSEDCGEIDGDVLPSSGNSDQEGLHLSATNSILSSPSKRDVSMMKRKQAETNSPHVAKRQKRPKQKFSFNFTQDPLVMHDPAILGCINRHDFFNSRKRSEANLESEQIDKSRLKSTLNFVVTSDSPQGKTGDSSYSTRKTERDTSSLILSPSSGSQFDEKSEIKTYDNHIMAQGFEIMPCSTTPTKIILYKGEKELQKPNQTERLPEVLKVDFTARDEEMLHKKNESPAVGGTNLAKDVNIYYRFKSTYPNYRGTFSQFLAICKRITNLVELNRMEHQSLWDDFIIRHKTEYSDYLRRCVDIAEDPIPYEKFYRDEIDEPKFLGRIVTRKTLHEISFLENQMDNHVSHQNDHQPDGDAKRENSLQGFEMSNVKSGFGPSRAVHLTSPPTFIDLTDDDNKISEPQKPPLSEEGNSPRSLPWRAWLNLNDPSGKIIGNTTLLSKSPPRDFSSTRLIQMTRQESTNDQNTRTSLPKVANSAKKEIIPLSSTRISERTTNEAKSTTSVVQVSDPSLAPMSPPSVKRSQSNAVDNISAELTTTTSKIKTTASHPTSPSVTDTPRDQQGNKEILNDSDSTKRLLTLERGATSKFEQLISSSPWWKDYNTPFTAFRRAYAAIGAGNGNSYASGGTSRSQNSKEPTSSTRIALDLKDIDVLAWWL